MNSHSENRIPEDEIDLGSLSARVGRIASYPFRLLASNIWTTLIFVAAAIALSVSLKYIIPKTYKSSFVIRPSDVSDKIYLKVLADLPVLLKQKEFDELSELLHLAADSLKTITRISYLNTSYKVGLDSTNFTEVVLETQDYRLFKPLQTAILNYLENNPYYLKIRNLQKAQIELATKGIDKDTPNLDSLKKIQMITFSKLATQNEAPLGSMLNSTAVYSLSLEHIDRKSKLLAQTIFIDRFQLVKPCVINKQPNYPPRILIICAILIPCFLLICFIFLLVRDRFLAFRGN